VHGEIQFGNERSKVECKTQGIAQQYKIAPMDTNVDGMAEITVEWGGKDGPTFTGSVSGSVRDNNGNKAEVKVEVDEPIRIKSFSRFFGSFEPIFASKSWGAISTTVYGPPILDAKIGQNNPKTRRKILFG